MKRRTRAGILATASLVACCSVSAAHATPQSPDIDPSPRADEQQVLTCEAELQEEQLIIQIDPAAGLIHVRVNGDSMEYEQSGSNVVVPNIADTTETMSIQVLDVADQRATCDAEPSEPSPSPSSTSPEPTPPTSDEPTQPDETSPTPDASTSTPTPTSTPPPSSGSTPSETPSSSATPPAQPDPSQPPVTPTPTQDSPAPYEPPSQSQTGPSSQNDTSRNEAGGPDEHAPNARSTPRDFRPYSQNPRYLLPQLLGIEPQRGSELLMPRPQSTSSQELETLPPVSEDELEAIKAELSSPGRADKVTDAQLESAETNERASGTSSWWVWGGAAVVIATGVFVSWLKNRRKRKH